MSSIPDYELQFRPNGCIAIALAPELFTRTSAFMYLATVEAYLIEKNSLGVKTLDPQDPHYSETFSRD